MRRSVLLVALALAGCAGGGDGDKRAASPTPTATRAATPPPATGRVTAGEEATIRGWADALRGGDVEAASRYFALPASVSNGTPPVALRTLRAVRFFNETLPCGARLVATERAERGFVVATFRLTERPGAGECGAGTGNRAYTAFLIRDGRIEQWVRVAGTGESPPPPPPSAESTQS
jgi:hypothetical protein